MATGQIGVKWDVKNLEIRTRSVELTLQPLVTHVTTLVNTKCPSKKRKGQSKRATVLAAAVDKATDNFIEKGQLIAQENPEIKTEMLAAVQQVQKDGKEMGLASREFADEPHASAKRAAMVQSGRKLLLAVTRLLILADMVDVHLLLKSLKVVEDALKNLQNVSNQAELLESFQAYGRYASDLMQAAAKRQGELKDAQSRDEMASARALLKKYSTMLLTTSKVYIRHPELASAKANRDFALRQVCEAVNTISDVVQGHLGHQDDRPGDLTSSLDDFDEKIVMEPLAYNKIRTRPLLEEQLESIIKMSALMADSSCTRDERRMRIVDECNAVRQALQDLLSEYMSNSGKKEKSQNLNRATDHTHRKTKDLRRQLRKAVGDHVSDRFLDTKTPLLALIQAAKEGDEEQFEYCAQLFTEHTHKLIEVANVASTMSNNIDGVKMARYAATQLGNLCPQVINAARILASRPKSKPVLENMEVFRREWETLVQLLVDAVDDITSIDDFLAVSENHILEDIDKCVLALEQGDAESFKTTMAIHGRSFRIANVVAEEMSNYEPGIYTQRVLESVKYLTEQVMPIFAQKVDLTMDTLISNPLMSVEPDDFIDAVSLVLDGVREIRRAVLMNRADDDLDPEEVEVSQQDDYGVIGGEHLVDEYPDITGITTAREAMRKLTEEDKERIAQQVESFRTEKLNFDREVEKWDDSGNDIIALAKKMCVIMMSMTDFTRGQGPLKTSMDVINAAKKISEVGKQLDKLAVQIADQCPESSTKKDLLAYLQQITLYCHQLNITSKVKADVQNVSGQLVVSGLDSATSLIQAAKNLMNAVVLTVQASYVASTKYRRQGTDKVPLVVWKMQAPKKKPLVLLEKKEDVRAIVRRGSQKKQQTPIQALNEFQV